jgi:hypothetical protein
MFPVKSAFLSQFRCARGGEGTLWGLPMGLPTPLRELKRLQFAKVSRTNVQRAAGPHCSEGSRACQTNKELQFWGQD